MTVLSLNHVQQLSLPLVKENVKMSVMDQLFVVEMQFVKQTITDPFVPALMDSLATLKMTKLDVSRNFVLLTLIVQETTFAWITDVLHLLELVAQSTENVDLMKFAKAGIVSILVEVHLLVESMPIVMFTTIRNNVPVLKALLEILKLNVFECLIPVSQIKDALAA